MEHKFGRALGAICLGTGILLILAGVLITFGFVWNVIGYVASLSGELRQGLHILRPLAASVGIIVTISGILLLAYPLTANRLLRSISQLPQGTRSRYFYLLFCLALSLIALLLGLLITRSGAGISLDSVVYIRAGESVFHGSGFPLDMAEPPLFPLSIAALMHLGVSGEQAARLVPIVCFALMVFPLFILGKNMNNGFTGCVACLMSAIFTPLLYVTSFAWSEMLYILLSVLAIMFLTKFARSRESRTATLFLAGFFAALAFLTRYMGITLLFTGLIVIAIKSRSQLRKMACQAFLFGLIPCLLIAPWLYRNIIVTSHLLGANSAGQTKATEGLLQNLKTAAETIRMDFFGEQFGGPLPRWLPYLFMVVAVVSLVLLGLYAAKRQPASKVLSGWLSRNHVAILYVFVYLGAVVVARSVRYFDPLTTRLVSPAYPFLILLAVSFLIYASRRIEVPPLRATFLSATAIVIVLFLLLQASSFLGFYVTARYGLGYNDPAWRNGEGIAWVAGNVHDEVVIYSDSADAVGFRLKRPCRYLPYSAHGTGVYSGANDEKGVGKFFEGLKNQEGAVIICFKQWHSSGFLSNDEIAQMNQAYGLLILAADFPDSMIWRVR